MTHGTDLPTAVLTGRFAEAVRWASHLHADQARKGTRIAYVSHLLAVSSLVLEDGGTEEEAIAGVLHDAIEDCHVSEAEIRARFGAATAEIVVAVSDDLGGPRDTRDWWDRKRAYLDRLEHDDLPPGTLRVAAADKLHNARSILSDLREHGPAIWDRFHRGAAAQRDYYREAARILRARHDSVLTRELDRVVAELVGAIDGADRPAPDAVAG
jgi:(p)ppGpp synthase/HD superfamily hydrolase